MEKNPRNPLPPVRPNRPPDFGDGGHRAEGRVDYHLTFNTENRVAGPFAFVLMLLAFVVFVVIGMIMVLGAGAIALVALPFRKKFQMPDPSKMRIPFHERFSGRIPYNYSRDDSEVIDVESEEIIDEGK